MLSLDHELHHTVDNGYELHKSVKAQLRAVHSRFLLKIIL